MSHKRLKNATNSQNLKDNCDLLIQYEYATVGKSASTQRFSTSIKIRWQPRRLTVQQTSSGLKRSTWRCRAIFSASDGWWNSSSISTTLQQQSTSSKLIRLGFNKKSAQSYLFNGMVNVSTLSISCHFHAAQLAHWIQRAGQLKANTTAYKVKEIFYSANSWQSNLRSWKITLNITSLQ